MSSAPEFRGTPRSNPFPETSAARESAVLAGDVTMKRICFKTAVAAGVALAAWLTHVSTLQPQERPAQPQANGGDQMERGRYLVHHVSQCVVCHSPKDARGNVIARRLLTGSPMPVKSPYANVDWALYCPPIAGLPGWEKQDAVYLLQHGHRRNGRAPRPPMPEFKMTEEDATAVVEYLMSLR